MVVAHTFARTGELCMNACHWRRLADSPALPLDNEAGKSREDYSEVEL